MIRLPRNSVVSFRFNNPSNLNDKYDCYTLQLKEGDSLPLKMA
jgi:hypothetical protein